MNKNKITLLLCCTIFATLISCSSKKNNSADVDSDVVAGSSQFETVADAHPLKWTWQWDEDGRLNEIRGPGESVMRIAYGKDANGNSTETMSYNNDIRKLTYNNAGDLIFASGGAAGVSFAYNSNQQPLEVQTADFPKLKYQHNVLGQLTELKIGETAVTYDYDYQGRLISVNTPAGKISYDYNLGKNNITRTLPNNVRSQYQYDGENRLVEILHSNGSKNIQSYRYTYRTDGLIAIIDEKGKSGTRKQRFSYDIMNRLVNVVIEGSDAATYRFAYDEMGNLAESQKNKETPLKFTNTTSGILFADSRGNCSSDKRGHIRELPSGNGTINYDYSESGKLAAAKNNSVKYYYDALDRMVARSVEGQTTRYLPNPFTDIWQPLWQRDAEGKETVTIWDNGFPLMDICGSQANFRLEDYQGSIRFELDASGQVIASQQYSPFGVPTSLNKTNHLQAGYAGLPYDPIAGVYLTKERAYDPITARFLQPDPKVRIPDESQHNHSLFAYCGGDPVNWVDVDGASPKNPGIFDWLNKQLLLRYQYIHNVKDEIWKNVIVQKKIENKYSLFTANINTVQNPNDGHFTPVSHYGSHTMLCVRENSTGEVIRSSSFTPVTKNPFRMLFSGEGKYEDIYDKRNAKACKIAIDQELANPNSNNIHHVAKLIVNFDDNGLSIVDNEFSKNITNPPNFHATQTCKWSANRIREAIEKEIKTIRSQFSNSTSSAPSFKIDNQFKYYKVEIKKARDYEVPPEFPRGPRPEGSMINDKWERPPPPPPSPVGGVYLGGAGKALEGLGALEGIAVDEATGNLVLIAQDGRSNAFPPLRLDDIVTVFRAVYEHGESPSVTIDPDKRNPTGPTMDVIHGPGTEKTYVGWILFECDRMMKCYKLNMDNVTKLPVKSNINGYEEMVDAVIFGDRSRSENSEAVWERYWIVPDKSRRYDVAANGLTLFDIPLKVNTQKMIMKNGVLEDDEKGKSSMGALTFSKWFSDNYGKIAEEYLLMPPKGSGMTEPVAIFQELRRIATVTAVAERLRAQGHPMPTWMRDYRIKPFPVATKTPSLNIEKTKGDRIVSIYGGVNLAPADADVRAFGRNSKVAPSTQAEVTFVESVKQKENLLTAKISEVAKIPIQASSGVKIPISKGENLAAVALPGAASQALASNQQTIVDISVPVGSGRSINIARNYNSFFDPDSEFGRGWTLDLPSLKWIFEPTSFDGKVSNSEAIPVLSTPLGTYNARFDKTEKVAMFDNSELYVSKDCPEIAGIGYGESQYFKEKLNKLFFKNGNEWHFDENGNLLVDQTQGYATCYERDNYGRVSRIISMTGKVNMGAIVLIYDTKGRIIKARVEQSAEMQKISNPETYEIVYKYDKNNQLVSVQERKTNKSKAELLAIYSYEGSNLTKVSNGGNQEEKFDYNKFGQLTNHEYNGNKIEYKTQTNNGRTALIQGLAGSNNNVVSEYDEKMRPLIRNLGKNSGVQWIYGKDKSSEEQLVENGKIVLSRKTSEDGKTLTETNYKTGNISEIIHDDLGNPIKICYNGTPVVNIQRYQNGEISSTTLHNSTEIVPLFHKEGWQKGTRFSNPNSNNDWTEEEQDILGRTTKIKESSGYEQLVNYDEKGRIASYGRPDRGNKLSGYFLTYNNEGQVTNISSSWSNETREYDKEGLLSRLSSKRGNNYSEHLFNDLGQIKSNKGYNGGITEWGYTTEGVLTSMKLANGKQINYSQSTSNSGETTKYSLGKAVVAMESNPKSRTMSIEWGNKQ